jgi:Fe-S cluster assembly protein SufD
LTTSALPSRRDEAWRYSDIDAVAAAWPLPAPESIIVPAGGNFARAIVQDAGDIRQIELVLGKGAAASLHVLNIGGSYGRIELNVILHEGADFHLGAAQIGGGEQNLEIVTTITHAEPGATSWQVVRSVLGGTATGTYLGKVAVARDAQQTDSEQDVKAMLLDRSATANAKHRTRNLRRRCEVRARLRDRRTRRDGALLPPVARAAARRSEEADAAGVRCRRVRRRRG